MEKKRVIVLWVLAVLLASVSVGGAAAAAGVLTLERSVVAGGGGRVEAGPYVLNATIGQPVAGWTSQGAYDLCSGFWCSMGRYESYLPVVLREL